MLILKDLLQSKKFIALIIGILTMVLQQVFDLDAETATKIAGLVGAYVLGQGLSDGLSGGMTSSQPGTPSAKDLPKNG